MGLSLGPLSWHTLWTAQSTPIGLHRRSLVWQNQYSSSTCRRHKPPPTREPRTGVLDNSRVEAASCYDDGGSSGRGSKVTRMRVMSPSSTWLQLTVGIGSATAE
jgi:hypothetical protein